MDSTIPQVLIIDTCRFGNLILVLDFIDFLPQCVGLLYLLLNECLDIFMHQQIVPEITADELIDERLDRRAVFAILPAYFFGVQRYFLL